MCSSPAGLCLIQRRCLFNDSYVSGVQENTSILFGIIIKDLAQKLTPKITMDQMIKASKVAPGVYLPYWHTENQESRRRKEYAYFGERNVKLEIMLNARLPCRLILMITSLLV